MESLIFAVNAISPIIITVAIGYILKKLGLMNGSFAKAANKLVFHLFLPCMLFLNIYKINALSDISFNYIIYATVALVAVFGISLPAVLIVTKKPERRGALWQACFRSNYALIGIPLAQSLFDEEGAMIASLLSAVIVPAINILAVICLSSFKKGGAKISIKDTLLGIVKNPLIQAIAIGLAVLGIRALLSKNGISFRLSSIPPIYTVLEYLSRLATPLALLCLGAQFEFSAVSELKREIIFGTVMRTAIVPTLVLGATFLFFRHLFNGAHFASFVAVFATPVSISSVPMTQEMDGDTVLAGQLVVWTTLASAFSVFLVAFLLKHAGIF